MRFLFEITHPKHVHLFKNAIRVLEDRGHDVKITARAKDVTLQLLDAYNFEYDVLSNQASHGMFALARELAVRDWRLFRIAKNFKPDVLVARVGPSAAHVGQFLRCPVVVFEDTEDGCLQQRISFPFVTNVCTADHYEKDWGKKHVRYKSFDELAYLHPSRFTPDRSVVERAGLEPGRYIVVRLVSWAAAHDVNQHGFDADQQVDILEELSAYGRVVITSEASLPEHLEAYRMPVAPQDFHHVLAFARLAFGESSTVATEAAVLGVPAVLVNTMNWGSVNRLNHYYELLWQTESTGEGLNFVLDLLNASNTPGTWRQRRKRLLEEENDLTSWMVQFLEEQSTRLK